MNRLTNPTSECPIPHGDGKLKDRQKYLQKKIEEGGLSYSEPDVPEPPDYLTLEVNSVGEFYIGVPYNKHFQVSDPIYQYWLAFLINKSDQSLSD